MNLCGFKLLLCLFIGYNLFDETTSFSAVPHHAFGQHAQFGEGVKDWFRNVKDKIHGVFFATTPRVPTTPPPPPPPTFQEVFQDFTQRAMNKFFYDTVSSQFNPDRDWGFRIGNWYIIRKCDGPNNGNPMIPNWNPFANGLPWTKNPNNPFLPPNGMQPTFAPTFPTMTTDEIETVDEHGRPLYPTSSMTPAIVFSTDSGVTPEISDHTETTEIAGRTPETTETTSATTVFIISETTPGLTENSGSTVLIVNDEVTPAVTEISIESETIIQTTAALDFTTAKENYEFDVTTPALVEEAPATTVKSIESHTRKDEENEVVTPDEVSAEVISPP